MKVEQFKEKYEALQKEAGEIYVQIKPLLKRLKSLTRKCNSLGNKADGDENLYDRIVVTYKDDRGYEGPNRIAITKGWDENILFRLWDMDVLITEPNVIDCIDNVLYNITHTKFEKKNPKKKK